MAFYSTDTGAVLLALVRERAAFSRLITAARSCADPTAKRLYNQLALDQLKSLLSLVSETDGLTDDWLTHLSLTIPSPEPADPSLHPEEGVASVTMRGEVQAEGVCGSLAGGVDQEELLALLESLRAEEEVHRIRLLSLLSTMEAGSCSAMSPSWTSLYRPGPASDNCEGGCPA